MKVSFLSKNILFERHYLTESINFVSQSLKFILEIQFFFQQHLPQYQVRLFCYKSHGLSSEFKFPTFLPSKLCMLFVVKENYNKCFPCKILSVLMDKLEIFYFSAKYFAASSMNTSTQKTKNMITLLHIYKISSDIKQSNILKKV